MKVFWLIVCIAVVAVAGCGMLNYIDLRAIFGNDADLRLKVLFPIFFVSLIAAGVLVVAMADKVRSKRSAEVYFRRYPPPSREAVAAKIAEIEMEMKRAGLWQSEPLGPEQYNFTRAFAMDTMAFSQWLQFIFIPRVKDIIAGNGEFPPRSDVGAQAVREFDGYDEAGHLCALLYEFDRLFSPSFSDY
jgi:uncharacterized protein YqcC (DUF446 family)